ncbi:hypothetical protein [Leeuwenhoekiella aequorea]|uniref:Uncharacterized protein n=1 Tax=Leeuwenhoekiella aequorea TaxID=283736 RepID=A0A4Q0PFM4_9FLAO|nr:hypothetical protein [Leeuwenhoekiella aequorea]RXG24959.1 hypothetical protein DSM00_755 [Leeuwenhoekiella aequorea]
MTTTFKKILITAVVAIPTAVISFLVIQYLLRDKSDIFQSLQKEAAYINTQTPLQLDEETTLDSAVAMNKNSFAYYYTLIYRSDAVNKDTVTKYVKPALIARLKNNPEMDYFREKKITLYYHYFGYDSLPAVTLKITPDLYSN